jgi:hypothetical protein
MVQGVRTIRRVEHDDRAANDRGESHRGADVDRSIANRDNGAQQGRPERQSSSLVDLGKVFREHEPIVPGERPRGAPSDYNVAGKGFSTITMQSQEVYQILTLWRRNTRRQI